MFPLDLYTAHRHSLTRSHTTLNAYKLTAKLFTTMEIPVAHTRQTISSIEYDRIACDQKCLKSNFLCASLRHVCTLQFTMPYPNVPCRESLTISKCSMVVIAIRWTDCAPASVMHTQTFGLSLCVDCVDQFGHKLHIVVHFSVNFSLHLVLILCFTDMAIPITCRIVFFVSKPNLDTTCCTNYVLYRLVCIAHAFLSFSLSTNFQCN